MANKTKTITDATLITGMLAFRRSLEISEATMTGLAPNDSGGKGGKGGKGGDIRIPVEVATKGVRGQTSNDTLKEADFNAGLSNPQSVDVAVLPSGCDRLEIAFSMTVMPNSRRPGATDTAAVADNFERLADRFAAAGGYRELALRYAGAIAAGRFAWRNREISRPYGATVTVAFGRKTVAFDPFALDTEKVPGFDDLARALKEGGEAELTGLVDTIAAGLEKRPEPIEVAWVGGLAPFSEVYPSQEYVRAEVASKDVAKVLASVKSVFGGRDIRWASMHSQKIGAALRTIDDWHANPYYGPVPANPYAGVQEAGIALRFGKKASARSFYELAKAPSAMWAALEGGDLAEHDADADAVRFFMANLVRGGVFGEANK